jgi:hypothetical protein
MSGAGEPEVLVAVDQSSRDRGRALQEAETGRRAGGSRRQRSPGGNLAARGRMARSRTSCMTKPASVLILGSGPVVIGQAAEFDYAGTPDVANYAPGDPKAASRRPQWADMPRDQPLEANATSRGAFGRPPIGPRSLRMTVLACERRARRLVHGQIPMEGSFGATRQAERGAAS